MSLNTRGGASSSNEPTPNKTTVSKSVRYQVLRRDNFACRYCGQAAPAVVLEVDHVKPRSLGGTNEPSNLVTACQDCNRGKSATSPTDELVADVAQREFLWAARDRKMADAAAIIRDAALAEFEATWERETAQPIWGVPATSDAERMLPADWKAHIAALLEAGVSPKYLLDAVKWGRCGQHRTLPLWGYVMKWGKREAAVIAEGRPADSAQAAL